MKFDCPRTCPKYEQRDSCRFNAVFAALGVAEVHSHTVKVKVELRDPDSLKAAVEALDGKWLGEGTHNLFSGQTATGHGFTLPGWKFPLVLDKEGELHFDDYKGAWGKASDIERLKGEYTLTVAANSAQANGWLCERQGQTLIVTHPSGGQLVVTANGAEANGFTGSLCHDALMALGLNLTDWNAKAELTEVVAEIQTQN